LNLTQFGEAYSAVIVRAFAEMSRAGEELLGPTGRGIVQISVTPSFAAFGALPHLDRLRNIDSALDFKIEARNTRVDFDTESIDAAVQLGAPSGRGLTSHRVFRSTLVPLAHPRIRDVYPRMKDERDLAMIPLIELNHVPKLWERWFAQSRFVIELPELTLSSDSLLAALQMAEAGVGAVLAPLPLVAPLVSSGRLSMLLPPRSPPKAPGFYLSYRTKDAGTAKIRSIRTWVKEIVQALDRQVAEMPFKVHDWNERPDPPRQSS
jgi:LysR family transcriptional regulator, glycine cleavage system transcriptional activator